MAKNANQKNIMAKVRRSLSEPAMPYLAENKLDAALYELRQSQRKLKVTQIKLYLTALLAAGIALAWILHEF